MQREREERERESLSDSTLSMELHVGLNPRPPGSCSTETKSWYLNNCTTQAPREFFFKCIFYIYRINNVIFLFSLINMMDLLMNFLMLNDLTFLEQILLFHDSHDIICCWFLCIYIFYELASMS